VVDFYFFDTSAIVKRYTHEIGSDWVVSILGNQPTVRIILSRITWVEVLSALSRLRRAKEISAAQLTREIRAFNQHFRTEYHVTEFSRTVARLAGELVQRQPLRAYDAVQLASALRLQEMYRPAESVHFTFVTADQRLGSVALSEGLNVVNPVEQ
jgi:predicted nucleic acid-binding protein